jgi:hypothetical protein
MANSGCISGRIAYFSADGAETGRERFDLIQHPGGYVLRAFCEMDAEALQRDVTLAMDTLWRPLDGFCRIITAGERKAVLWFDVTETQARLTGWVNGAPVADMVMPTTERLVYLGLHPLQGDALIVNARGTGQPGVFVPIPCATNSVSPNGDEDVSLRAITIDVAYIGPEDVTVAAGTFEARHYQLRWDPAWPPADLWVRREDCLFLAMDWSFVAARYELVEFTETARGIH